jgi:hypothetical protein
MVIQHFLTMSEIFIHASNVHLFHFCILTDCFCFICEVLEFLFYHSFPGSFSSIFSDYAVSSIEII